jgi:hypothetical protein
MPIVFQTGHVLFSSYFMTACHPLRRVRFSIVCFFNLLIYFVSCVITSTVNFGGEYGHNNYCSSPSLTRVCLTQRVQAQIIFGQCLLTLSSEPLSCLTSGNVEIKMFIPVVILFVVVYACETWSHAFWNRMRRKIFGSTSEEVRGD